MCFEPLNLTEPLFSYRQNANRYFLIRIGLKVRMVQRFKHTYSRRWLSLPPTNESTFEWVALNRGDV